MNQNVTRLLKTKVELLQRLQYPTSNQRFQGLGQTSKPIMIHRAE